MFDSLVTLFHKECYYIRLLLGLVFGLFKFMIRPINHIIDTYMQTGLPFFDNMTPEKQLTVLEREVHRFPSKENIPEDWHQIAQSSVKESVLLQQAQSVKKVQVKEIRVSRQLDLE